MPTVLQEVDPDDLSTVLWDFSDSTGAANPGTVKTYFGVGGTFNLSAPGVNIDTSDRLGDGAQDVTFSYDDIVSSSFRMKAQATNYDNLRQGIGVLQRILAADGVMRFIPSGSSNTFYIYRKPSSIPALFAGDELELYQRLALFDSPEGIEIVVNRERLLRGPTLLASVNKLRNSTMLLSSATDGPANAPLGWLWASATNITTAGYGANVNWANQSFRFTIATTGTRNLRTLIPAAGSAAPGDVWTFSVYAKASGGSLAKAQAVVEFLDAANAVLATATGTLTTLSSTEQRLTVTTAAAPASTSKWRPNVQFANGDATTYTVDLRRAQLEKAAAATQFRVGAETVGNDQGVTPWGSMFVYNPGDANALARLTLTPSSGKTPVAFLLGRKSEGLDVNLAEMVNAMTSSETSNRTKQALSGVTLYSGTAGDTSSQADSAATGAAAAKTTFTNQTPLVRRWRWVSTPTDPEALHGTWDVYAAVKGEINSTFRLSLHWQAANRDPVTNVEEVISFDTTDVASTNDVLYAPLLLGQVTFDADAGDASLTLEGWAARDSGSGAFWWDQVYLLPADEQQAIIQVPGFRRGRQSEEVWLGSELTTQVAGAGAGTGTTATAVPAGSTKVVMAEQWEGVGTPPSSASTGGLVWAAGRHVVKAFVQLQEPAPAVAVALGAVRIRKAPGVGGTVSVFANSTAYSVGDFVKPTALNRNGRTYRTTTAGTSAGSEPAWGTTAGGTTSSGGAVFTETTVATVTLKTKEGFTSTRFSKSVAADADGSTAYEGVVIMSAGTVAGRKIHVLTLRHSTQRVVDNGYSAQMLGDLEVLQTVNGTTGIDDMVKEGPYITLGPGLNVLWVDLWSQAPVAYDDIDPRDPLAYHSVSGNTATAVDIIPRYWS